MDPDPKLLEMALAWQKKEAKRKEKEAYYRGRALSALRAEGKPEPREREIRARIYLIKQERAEKWRLANCRATLGELVKAKQQNGGQQ